MQVSKRFVKRVRNLFRDDANAYAETLAERYRQQQRGGDRRTDHEARQLMEDILEPRTLTERRRRALLTTFRELDEHRELLQAMLEHAASQWETMYRSIVTAAVGVSVVSRCLTVKAWCLEIVNDGLCNHRDC